MREPLFSILGTAVLMAVAFSHAYTMKMRSRHVVSSFPELKEDFEKLFKRYLLLVNIPLVIMLLGLITGNVPSIFYLLMPRDGNPFVIALDLTVVCLLVLGVIWIYFKGGAELLTKPPSVVGIKSPIGLKIYFALCVVGSILAFIDLWFRVPHF
jgi:hypothetical protein